MPHPCRVGDLSVGSEPKDRVLTVPSKKRQSSVRDTYNGAGYTAQRRWADARMISRTRQGLPRDLARKCTAQKQTDAPDQSCAVEFDPCDGRTAHLAYLGALGRFGVYVVVPPCRDGGRPRQRRRSSEDGGASVWGPGAGASVRARGCAL